MSRQVAELQEATIKAQCKALRMPMISSQFSIRKKKSHIGYLEASLLAKVEERERNTIERRIREAHLPRMKTIVETAYLAAAAFWKSPALTMISWAGSRCRRMTAATSSGVSAVTFFSNCSSQASVRPS